MLWTCNFWWIPGFVPVNHITINLIFRCIVRIYSFFFNRLELLIKLKSEGLFCSGGAQKYFFFLWQTLLSGISCFQFGRQIVLVYIVQLILWHFNIVPPLNKTLKAYLKSSNFDRRHLALTDCSSATECFRVSLQVIFNFPQTTYKVKSYLELSDKTEQSTGLQFTGFSWLGFSTVAELYGGASSVLGGVGVCRRGKHVYDSESTFLLVCN